MRRFKVTISIGLQGKRVDYFEIDEEELAGMAPDEIEAHITECAEAVRDNYLDWGWEEVEPK